MPREHTGCARLTPSVEELVIPASFRDVAEHFRSRRHFALLETQTATRGAGEYSFLAFSPFATLRSKGGLAILETADGEWSHGGDVFAMLRRMLERYAVPAPAAGAPEGIPFRGGALGYFGYELGRQIETLPGQAVDEVGLPDCHLAFYNFAVALRHDDQRLFLCHLGGPASLGPSKRELLTRLARVTPGIARRPSRVQQIDRDAAPCLPDFSRAEYIDAVQRIRDYIYAGDVYQVNMTQRFRADVGDMPPWELFQYLALVNPSPFASYLNLEGASIVSSSPERFLRVAARRIETKPIKGTIRRAATPAEDARNGETLLASAKNRAELAMIVDLLRNDIGRVCTPGSVHVEAFPQLESYASVHHLVATITGELAADRSLVDLIAATFPGGSITGAPKIRAMEIIDELEPVARGVYTGSIGYLGFDGTADLNIAIRTIVMKDGCAHIHAGGGVVADSNPADEYDESLLKASKLIEAVQAVATAREPVGTSPFVMGVATDAGSLLGDRV
jgi:para-aminobenzoate synthetase component 1